MKIHLNISGRQTGKTTNLINKAAEIVSRYIDIHYLSCNHDANKWFRDELPKTCSTNRYNEFLLHKIDDYIKFNTVSYLFLDEFDFLDEETSQSILNYLKNSKKNVWHVYASTTPIYVRPCDSIEDFKERVDYDLLSYLLVENEFRYETHNNLSVRFNLSEDPYTNRSLGCRIRETAGIF